MRNVDFCITTFLRPDGLYNLLESINKYYPDANIYVAQQGDMYEPFERFDKFKVIFFKLPFDFGLSASRNYLVKNTKAKYVLILEDDFIFNIDTRIEKMVKLLEYHEKFGTNVGVVGGLVKENWINLTFEHKLLRKGNILLHLPDGDNWRDLGSIRYKYTDCVLNFALFRREVFDDIMWDDKLKLADHNDFYLRLKDTKWNVIYTPCVWLDTKKVNSAEYKKYKKRKDFLRMLLKKHKLEKIVYVDGMVRELKDGVYKTYTMLPNELKEFFNKLNIKL